MFNRNNVVNIDDTRFIFQTNFSGDPNRDRFGSNRRVFNIVIPTEAQANDLIARGVTVRQTRPNPERTYDGGFVPSYFTRVTVNMESKWPPHVYWITPNGNRVECDATTIGQLDYIRVKNVCCQAKLVAKKNQPGSFTLYADILYVEQDIDYDPYYKRYHQVNAVPIEKIEDDDLPF